MRQPNTLRGHAPTQLPDIITRAAWLAAIMTLVIALKYVYY